MVERVPARPAIDQLNSSVSRAFLELFAIRQFLELFAIRQTQGGVWRTVASPVAAAVAADVVPGVATEALAGPWHPTRGCLWALAAAGEARC